MYLPCICHTYNILHTWLFTSSTALADCHEVSFLFVYLHNKYICKYIYLGDQLSQHLLRWLLLILPPLPPQTSSPWSCTCWSWRPDKPNVQSGSYLKVISSVLFEKLYLMRSPWAGQWRKTQVQWWSEFQHSCVGLLQGPVNLKHLNLSKRLDWENTGKGLPCLILFQFRWFVPRASKIEKFPEKK